MKHRVGLSESLPFVKYLQELIDLVPGITELDFQCPL
jgi:hypothetical protein